MSNYTKATNFATKDALTSGDPNKVVKGTEIDNEFNAIAGAIASKADTASPALTGTPTAPTAVTGTNTTQIATTAFATASIQGAFPVGSIYINASNSSNPSVLLGFGTWSAFGAGRVLVGFDSTNALFDTAEETGGSADAIVVAHSHTATSSSSVYDPGHKHTLRMGGGGGGPGPGEFANSNTSYYPNNMELATTGISVSTSTSIASSGSSGTNANYQPYITVYMWKRTA